MESHIPIENVYFLLCYAWNRLEEKELVNIDAVDSVHLLELFSRVLISGMHHLMKHGFDRGYVQFGEEIGCIKGKINVPNTLKRQLLRKGRAYCYYDELNHNVLHNQIIKTTIKYLTRHPNLDKKLVNDLLLIYRRLHAIDEIRITSTIFSRVQLSRNNAFYGFLLNICEMIYENILSKEGEGDYTFKEFLRDEQKMSKVFEDFVRNFYQIELKKVQPECSVIGAETIHWDAIAHNENSQQYLPKMETDISIQWPDRYLIIDTKYYKQTMQSYHFSETIHSSNMYQLFSYIENIEKKGKEYKSCEGMLLYPTIGKELDLKYTIKSHPVAVRTINLNQEWKLIYEDLLKIVAL